MGKLDTKSDIGVLRDGLGRKISIKHLWREDMYDKEN